MRIEFKIKFEKDGLTISQDINPASTSGDETRPNRTAIGVPLVSLPGKRSELGSRDPRGGTQGDPFGGTQGDPFGGTQGDPFGGNPPGSAPVFVLGPIIFNGANHAQGSSPEGSPGNDIETKPKSEGQK
ncbi:MAG: hypothetical protein JO307_01175 [Bryobacterales bacterium]|nr:hypothetical protein [Bryobacterales bacterium]MBV9398267.1 hypothetical protein [Bryobacterales bacterium]